LANAVRFDPSGCHGIGSVLAIITRSHPGTHRLEHTTVCKVPLVKGRAALRAKGRATTTAHQCSQRHGLQGRPRAARDDCDLFGLGDLMNDRSAEETASASLLGTHAECRVAFDVLYVG